MTQSVAPWLDAPLAEFVRQARVSLAVALEPSGRVLAQARQRASAWMGVAA